MPYSSPSDAPDYVGMCRHFGAQQFAPDVRVLYVGELMQLEVTAGLRVGTVALRQAIGFLLGDARNLRLVRIERSQRFGCRAFARDATKFGDQFAYFRQRLVLANLLAIGAHAFGKIEPQLAVRTALDLLPTQIAQHRAAQLAIVQARVQRAQIGRKSGDVMIVVGGIFAQIFARQLTGGPRLVIGMAQKVVAGNALLERSSEKLAIPSFHPT